MPPTSSYPCGRTARFLSRRRLLIAPLLSGLAAMVLLFAPSLANADSATSLGIVGTSDVNDSGLIPNLIEPEFHAAFPQFTFKYFPTASGTAITDVQTGVDQASVLLVHAPSEENGFVAGGGSLEPFGRAVFTNDFVLGGPAADPAGVSADGAHNIVQAFIDIATKGYNGGGTPLDTFVSRGSNSGTTVKEHAIWQQIDQLNEVPAGMKLCTVTTASNAGGGETPVIPSAVTNNGDPCPNGGVAPGTSSGILPSWYQVTGANQATNVTDANACTGYSSGANTCYVLTDRGTYDYLLNGGTPAGAASVIPNLSILTRNDDASAPGGVNELTNYFHVYILNPAKSPTPVNVAAATDFVNFITSPALQKQLSSYLNQTSDPGGPPFVADASPALTSSAFPSTVAAGQPVTVTGNLTNAEPGFPALAGKQVSVDEVEGLTSVPVATGTTDTNGNYSITFTPPSSGSYQVTTGQIQQVEETLNPVFGDLLSPAATTASAISVQGAVFIAKTTPSTGGVSVVGAVAPAAPDGNGTVALLARKQGSTGAFTEIGGAGLTAGQRLYALSGSLTSGAWQVEVSYRDPGVLTAATGGPVNVTVPAPAAASATKPTTASFKKLTVKNGKLTLTGTLNQGPTASGAHVALFALSVANVKVNNPKSKKTTFKAARVVARATSVSLSQVAKTSIGKGKKTFTIKHTFKRGHRYALQLEFVQKGQTSTYSKLRTLDVH